MICKLHSKAIMFDLTFDKGKLMLSSMIFVTDFSVKQ